MPLPEACGLVPNDTDGSDDVYDVMVGVVEVRQMSCMELAWASLVDQRPGSSGILSGRCLS